MTKPTPEFVARWNEMAAEIEGALEEVNKAVERAQWAAVVANWHAEQAQKAADRCP